MPAIVCYPAGHVVIRQGEVDDLFYLIIKGTVEVCKTTSHGEQLRLRMIGDGKHFGEIASLKNVPRTATVRTLTDCEFYAFTRNELLNLLKSSPQLSESIEQEIPLLLRASTDQNDTQARSG